MNLILLLSVSFSRLISSQIPSITFVERRTRKKIIILSKRRRPRSIAAHMYVCFEEAEEKPSERERRERKRRRFD